MKKVSIIYHFKFNNVLEIMTSLIQLNVHLSIISDNLDVNLKKNLLTIKIISFPLQKQVNHDDLNINSVYFTKIKINLIFNLHR